MHPLKSKEEIALMREAGLMVWRAHQVAADLIKPGITTSEINEAVEQFLAENKVIPLFKGVPGKVPFPAAACISVNDEIVHGIPGRRRLKEGDIVSIDIGSRLNGWCGDAAVTHAVGKIDAKKQKLLDVTEETLRLAIQLVSEKERWSQVARAMQRFVENAGFSVVENLVGHGIGRDLWASPQVPNYFSPNFARSADFALTPGLVIAVEPMVNMGSKPTKLLSDHWTISTQDGQPSAHFEHTIALTEDGPQVLTAGPDGRAWSCLS
ncbi:MAG: type I methionyl aminopeptidase [Ktedonobacteraceae bacterium]